MFATNAPAGCAYSVLFPRGPMYRGALRQEEPVGQRENRTTSQPCLADAKHQRVTPRLGELLRACGESEQNDSSDRKN